MMALGYIGMLIFFQTLAAAACSITSLVLSGPVVAILAWLLVDEASTDKWVQGVIAHHRSWA